MDTLKEYGENVSKAFAAGYKAAKDKTVDALEKEYTTTQKGIIIAGVLAIGVVIGLALALFLHKDEYEFDDVEDFEDFED